ncbi:GNAT family N-acetyltransferase [Streptomyces sp. NPDC088725]|uniref:GNAT family N-acetyltransferase n=1 Tax=Streptomyces sp. NPDC088725 TaxID=3365873 RepID=UPI0037FB1090
MSTPLSAFPVRHLTLGDLAWCANLCEDRGWAREERRWNLLLAAGTAYGIDAPDGDGLAATCVVTSYGPALAAVGMMLVAQRFARQGIGRRLMTHVLSTTGSTPLTLYATQFGQPLYEQLGFVEIGSAETVQGHFRSAGSAPGARIRPAVAADLMDLARLDGEAFGADRVQMITRLPAFSDRLLVAEDDSGLTGYAAAWSALSADVSGPVIARDTSTAKALISKLAEGAGRPLRTTVDTRHGELLAWMKERGLEPVTVSTVMTNRVPDLPGDWTRRFAPLSLATG